MQGERGPGADGPGAVADPPRSLGQALRRIGPGMILAAAIVGSGELIATTTLGAEVGYAALWIVLGACLVKPIVQAVLGRHAIATGESALVAMNRVPGPRWRVGWVVWAWAATVLMTQLQVGAMLAGAAQILGAALPAVGSAAWVLGLAALTWLLLAGGGYARIERLATFKVALFTLLTVLAAVVLVRGPGFRAGDLVAGLAPSVPAGGLATAIAVFGITGVGATELFQYPTWCLEKGYARFAGSRDGSSAWQARAAGWIRVMHLDIALSTAVFTLATVAFYLLGAGVLHPAGVVPAAKDTIAVLSRLYTETLGSWARPLFYAGALVTLYGAVFAATAAHARLFADLAQLLGRFADTDAAARDRHRRGFVVLLTILPAVLTLAFASPVKMVVAGGMAQALMLPIAAAGTLYLRHHHLPPEIAPARAATIALWLAAALITAFTALAVALALAAAAR